MTLPLDKVLFNNAHDFLNAGLEYLIKPDATDRDCKMSLVMLQTSWELFLKHHLYLQDVEITDSVINQIQQKKYWQCKKEYLDSNELTEYEKTLLENFQSHRNQIVHFGMSINSEELQIKSTHFLLKVIRRVLVEDERDDIRKYIDSSIYASLLSFKPYIHSVEEDLQQFIGLTQVKCYKCLNNTMTIDEDGEYYCYACGSMGNDTHMPYFDCPYCKVKLAAIYDALNKSDEIYVGGCLSCRESIMVSKCIHCDDIVFPEIFAVAADGKHWMCSDCNRIHSQ